MELQPKRRHSACKCPSFSPSFSHRQGIMMTCLLYKAITQRFLQVRREGFFYNSLSLEQPLRFFISDEKQTVFNRKQLFMSFVPFAGSIVTVFLLGTFVNIKHNHVSKKTWFGSSNQLLQYFRWRNRNHTKQDLFVLCNNIKIPLFPGHIYLAVLCGRASEVSYLNLYLGSWNSSSLKAALIFWM